ncbi:methyl-accepting chemotaxis protein [Oryzibacter oryziterrae]|uniref:methyl-accepting chemotaxis protein n=1 Tax=Oryzibacter oryziterrae TaxID=2766474 RepID=UPI001F002961|nr:methyl-accepting chemotaxis protein [Oryzibacter oryziterrae]
MQGALHAYSERETANADLARDRIESSLVSVYRNIRTISFLPSVRKLQRHGENLDNDARESIQQIYNNLASSVSVSEVYLVPASFDPAKVDPVTGAPETPSLMFDELIPAFGKAKESGAPQDPAIAAVPELEDEEYRLLVNQIAQFKSQIPEISEAVGINVPMLSGPQVITCDNSRMTSATDDKGRSGMLFTVPTFDDNKKFNGVVAAIILDGALQDLLPNKDFALVNAGYHYVASSRDPGQVTASADYVVKAQPDPSLAFSTVLQIPSADSANPWQLWVGRPNDDFLNSADVSFIRTFSWIGYGVILFASATMAFVWFLLRRSAAQAKLDAIKLEHRLAEQAAELAALAKAREEDQVREDEQRRSILIKMAEEVERSTDIGLEDVVGGSERMRSQASDMSSRLSEARLASQAIADASKTSSELNHRAMQLSDQVITTVGTISKQIERNAEISRGALEAASASQTTVEALSKAANDIGQIVSVISSIAAQTNLLALNATIEAARAGDAGRGFAVVANEVKSLAVQTERSTQEVTAKIEEIQSATSQVVGALQAINSNVVSLENATVGMLQQVQGQRDTVHGFAESIRAANVAVSEVADHAATVESAITESYGVAIQVNDVATTIEQSSHALRQEVPMIIRNAMDRADRRKSVRTEVALPCQISAQGQSVEARMCDVSQSGLKIKCRLPLDVGDGLRVDLPIGRTVDGTVAWVNGDFFGVAFAEKLSAGECARIVSLSKQGANRAA